MPKRNPLQRGHISLDGTRYEMVEIHTNTTKFRVASSHTGHVEQRDEGLVADRHRGELEGIRGIDDTVQRAKN